MEVYLSWPSDDDIWVDWSTFNGTAVESSDYDFRGGILNFDAGETKRVVELSVRGDRRKEKDEFFFAELRPSSLQRVGSTVPEVVIHLANDDDGEMLELPPGDGEGQNISDWTLPDYKPGWEIDEDQSVPECVVWRALASGVGGSLARYFSSSGILAFDWKLETESTSNRIQFTDENSLPKVLEGNSRDWQTVVARVEANSIPIFIYFGTGPDENNQAFVKNLRFYPGSVGGNRPPLFTSEPIDRIMAGSAYFYSPMAEDPEGETVLVEVPIHPAWLHFENGILSGTPSLDDGERIDGVEVRATDASGATTEQKFGILVHDGDPEDALVWKLESFGFMAGDPVVSGNQADPDGDGVSNELERALGFDPSEPERGRDVFGIRAFPGAGADLRLALPAVPPENMRYQVQSFDVVMGDWQSIATRQEDGTWVGVSQVGSERILGDRTFVEIRDRSKRDWGIYRLMTEQQ